MSLKTRFILIYGVGNIFFMALITVFVFSRMENEMVLQLQQQFNLNAEIEINTLNETLGGLTDKYKSISSIPMFKSIRYHQLTLNESALKNDIRQLELYFLNFQKQHEEITKIDYLDASGLEVIRIEDETINRSLSDLSQNVMVRSALQVDMGQIFSTTLFKADHPDEIVLWIPVDISESVRLGIIGIYMDFNFIERLVKNLEKKSVTACIYDSMNRLIMDDSSRSTCSAVQTRLWQHESNLALPGNQWSIRLLATPESYLGEVSELRWLIFVFALPAFALMALTVIYFTTLTITRSIREIVRSTRTLGTEHDFIPVQLQRKDELGMLANEVNRTAKHIQVKTKALVESNLELESYSYSIAHDLRAPLRSIAGFSQILKTAAHERLEPSEHEKLDRIIAATKKMSSLIDDILQLARLTRKQLELQPVNLSALANEILQDFQQAEPDREVSWQVDKSGPVQGDPVLLRVMLENLLGNAWKYTGQQKTTIIEFKNRYEDKQLIFYIRDNGAGFNMQYVDTLFIPFSRLHTSDEFEGTGIGLATAKRIMLKHHGDIWIDSKLGQGTTVFFKFDQQLDTLRRYL